jgi:hypothetical protein
MSGPVSPTTLLATVLPLLTSALYSLVDIAVQPFSPAKSSQGGIFARYQLIFKQASLVHSFSPLQYSWLPDVLRLKNSVRLPPSNGIDRQLSRQC